MLLHAVPTSECNPNFATCPNASETSASDVPTSECNPNFVTCPNASETSAADVSPAWAAWGANATLETTCFEGDGTFNFGIYHMALQLMKDGSAMAKIFYGLFFGIMTLSSCLIRDGYFCGEELLSWGLGHSPDTNQLPSATATLTTVTAVEGFVLEAEDLLFVTTHFKFNWKSQRIQRWVRYYSPHWRTWAALTIQIAWRRHVARQHATSLQRSLDAHADVDVRGGQLTIDTPSGAPPTSAATAPAPVPATATATTIDTPTMAPISRTAPLDPALTTTAGGNGGGGTRLGRPRMDADEIEALQRRDRMRLYSAIFSSSKPRGSMDKNS
ncbi:unnamed protein product [Closterium sp. Naga37s-1]|nr:unnamed protein product [Closterium sp. Naga37s-1]